MCFFPLYWVIGRVRVHGYFFVSLSFGVSRIHIYKKRGGEADRERGWVICGATRGRRYREERAWIPVTKFS